MGKTPPSDPRPSGRRALTRRQMCIHRRALAILERGNWLRAVHLLRTEMVRTPDDTTAVLLIRIYLDAGLIASAESLISAAFARAEEQDPAQVCPCTVPQRQIYRLKANLDLQQGDAACALSLYTLLLTEEPDDLDLLYHTSLAYERLGQRDMAITYLDRVLAEDPSHLPAKEVKGQILLALGRHTDALHLYTEITLAHPNNINGYAMMGRIYYHLDRPVAAVYAWERAVALAPNADMPLYMLGHIALQRGDTPHARDLLTRAVAANRMNVAAHLDLAELLATVGETRAALAHWDEVESLVPRHPALARCRERREAVQGEITTTFAMPRVAHVAPAHVAPAPASH